MRNDAAERYRQRRQYLDLTVRGKPQPVARATEVVRHAADETKTAIVARNDVRPGGVV